MMSDKEKKAYKESIEKLRDAYFEILHVFHNTKHYTVQKSVHEALFPINRAIVDLEETLEKHE
jgi:GTP cyclohydrolase III